MAADRYIAGKTNVGSLRREFLLADLVISNCGGRRPDQRLSRTWGVSIFDGPSFCDALLLLGFFPALSVSGVMLLFAGGSNFYVTR
jgi:hypothetical protein